MSVNSSLTLWRNNPKGGAVFDPTTLSNPHFIGAYPDDVLTDVDGVYEVTDISSAGNDFVQNTGSLKPDVITSSSGLQGVMGDDIDDRLDWSSALEVGSGSPWTVAVLWEYQSSVGAEGDVLSNTGSNGRLGWFGSGIRVIGSSGGWVTINDGTSILSHQDTPIRLIVTKGSDNALRAWVGFSTGLLSEVTSGSPSITTQCRFRGWCGYYSSGYRPAPGFKSRLAVYTADHSASVSDLDDWLQEGLP